jgi:hypothetical protein
LTRIQIFQQHHVRRQPQASACEIHSHREKEMPFSDETVQKAWCDAKGKCECRRSSHDHPFAGCNRELVWENRGRDIERGAWEAHHMTRVMDGREDELSNCEILCWECHKKTL